MAVSVVVLHPRIVTARPALANVRPIELVDGEKLVTMFDRVGIGRRPVQDCERDAALSEGLKVLAVPPANHLP